MIQTPLAVEDFSPKKDQFFRVEWNLGKRCNYDCSYCSPGTHDKTSEHLSLEIIDSTSKKLAQHAQQTNRQIRLSLTGGEPYIHPQFFEILKIIKANQVDRISITSNGSLPAKTYIESLEWVNYLILSIHFEFSKISTLTSKIIKIQNAVNEYNQTKQFRGLHVHLMALPGKIDEALIIQKELLENGVEVALRRIRPQYAEDGTFLMPFNSGQLGGFNRKSGVIEKNNLHYYSSQDLEKLGVHS